MNEKDKQSLERYKARIERQNEQIRQKYDRVSCTLPKGTKERIQQNGESINGLINRLVLSWLDEQEQNGKE